VETFKRGWPGIWCDLPWHHSGTLISASALTLPKPAGCVYACRWPKHF
jgi:hypothetical protein